MAQAADKLNPSDPPICQCGHYRDLHGGEGDHPCTVEGCSCQQFVEVDLWDTDLGKALDAWIKEPEGTVSIKEVMKKWVDAHGGAESFANQIGPEVAEELQGVVHSSIARQATILALEALADDPVDRRKAWEQVWRDMDERSHLAVWLWCRYYVACELFDRTVCSVRDERGIALPSNPGEYAAVQHNAQIERRRRAQAADLFGLTAQELQRAQHHTEPLTFEERDYIYRHPPKGAEGIFSA